MKEERERGERDKGGEGLVALGRAERRKDGAGCGSGGGGGKGFDLSKRGKRARVEKGGKEGKGNVRE